MPDESQQNDNVITSSIWQETAHPDNRYLADECYLRGIPFFTDTGILKNAGAFELLFFAYTGRRPKHWEIELLEKMTVSAMTIGPRSYPARAALAAGAGHSTTASMIIASTAAGSGQLGGGRELMILLEYWLRFGTDTNAWLAQLKIVQSDGECRDTDVNDVLSVWPPIAYPPGHDPNISSSIPAVAAALKLLADLSQGSALPWLAQHRETLENSVNMPLALVAVIAAGFHDLEFKPTVAEFFWLWMLNMASGLHGIEQMTHGADKYPLFPQGIKLAK